MKSFKRAIYKINNYFDDVQQISCNSSLSTDGKSGIYEVEVNLGTSTGEVVINYESFSIPDRFQVFKEDGSLLADSKFVGDGLDNREAELKGTHTLPLFKYNDGIFEDTGTTETITIDNSDIANGTSGEPKEGNGKLRFQKEESKNWIVTIKVTGIIGSTIWNLSASCPSNQGGKSTYNISTKIRVYDLVYHKTISDIRCDYTSVGKPNTYYSQQGLQIGTTLYTDTNLIRKAPSGYAFLGKTIYELKNGQIIKMYPCYQSGA